MCVCEHVQMHGIHTCIEMDTCVHTHICIRASVFTCIHIRAYIPTYMKTISADNDDMNTYV